MLGGVLNPILRPCVIPEIKKITKGLLEYSANSACHAATYSGLGIAVASGRTITVSGSSTKYELHTVIYFL